MTELPGTVIIKLNRSEITNMMVPPTMIPGSSRMFACPAATSYAPNAKLATVNKVAKEIAPTLDAVQAASKVARTIGGAASQIFRVPDTIALRLRAPARLLTTERRTEEGCTASPALTSMVCASLLLALMLL